MEDRDRRQAHVLCRRVYRRKRYRPSDVDLCVCVRCAWQAAPFLREQLFGIRRERPKGSAQSRRHRCTTNYGNDPATGTETTISHVDSHGFQSNVDPECACFIASVVVRDLDRGREIEVEDPQAGPLLREVASAHRPVVLTGMSKSMLPDHCEVAVVWDIQYWALPSLPLPPSSVDLISSNFRRC
jgi:hypothetical protein